MKHVAVLMGGMSAERPVSLNSGKACAAALRGAGFKVTEVDAGRDLAEVLNQLRPDVAFNVLHGKFGEDGCIPGLLEVLGIPYTHSGVLASSMAMKKDIAKIIMAQAGVPVAHGVTVDRFAAAKAHALPPPYVAKPVSEGSSLGIVIVKEGRSHPPQELARADWPYGDVLLVEEFIPGRELTCAVMGSKDGPKALGVIEVLSPTTEFYDYEAKYSKGGSIHVLPADIKPNVYRKVQELSERAHAALGCRGVSRADFRYDEASDRLICLEVNTQPGMTETSLVPELAVHAGLSFGELVTWLVEDASLER
jgi:D-alanine-D-alanine ligase